MKTKFKKRPPVFAVPVTAFALMTVLFFKAGSWPIAKAPAPLNFDIDKCISSCDVQYADCVKRGGGTAETINYCDLHHKACTKGCMEHK